MTTIERTCATCSAFNPAPEGDAPACWNLSTIIKRAGARQPGQQDWCHHHKTHEEDRAEDAAIALFWQRIGIERRPGMGRLSD